MVPPPLSETYEQMGNVAPVPCMNAAVTNTGSTLAQALAPLNPSLRSAHVEAAVLCVVRELTGASEKAVEVETPLMEAGVDSLAATELSSRLKTLSGVVLSPTIVFEQPTPRAVAAHLLELSPQSIDQKVGGRFLL